MSGHTSRPVLAFALGFTLVLFAGDGLALGAEGALEDLPLDGSLYEPVGTGAKVRVVRLVRRVRFGIIPGQDRKGRLWSSWGDAWFASDGLFYVSLGDHGAPFGRSYVWSVDPAEGRIRLAVDYNRTVGLKPPAYAPGKIHAPLVEVPDGALYVVGYRGSVRHTGPETGFRGDWLLRYDLHSRRCEVVGVPVSGYSTPVLTYCPANRLLYGLAVPGLARAPDSGESLFYRYDPQRRVLVTALPYPAQGPRAMILARDGRAWVDGGDGRLLKFDPDGGDQLVKTDVVIPGNGRLRAASRPNRSGVAYCISQDGVLFRFDTVREIVTVLGECFPSPPRYTAVCKLDRSERYLYYLPGAHGRTRAIGTPVVRLDTESGEIEVIAFLHACLLRHAGYYAGGSYGLAIDNSGKLLCIVLNGSLQPKARQPDFGTVAVVLLDLEER